MKKLSHLLLAGAVFLMVGACNLTYFEDAQIGDITFDPALAVPIGEISYTVEELFDELNDAGADIGTTDDNVISIIYEQDLQSQTATSFLAVLDQSYSQSLRAGRTVFNPTNEIRFSQSQVFEFDISQRGNEAYDSINFSGGNLRVSLSSDYDVNVNYTLTFLSLEQNNRNFTLAGTLRPGNNSVDINQGLQDFKGYFHLDRNGDPSTDKFLVDLAYEVVVPPGATVNTNDALDMTIGVENTTFNDVFGDVGTQDLTVSFDVANLDFFKQFSNGTIRFAEPSVDLIFQNSFGFPLGVSFPEFAAIESDGTITRLSGSIVDNPSIVTAPTVDRVGDIELTNISINTSNSNLDQLLSVQPTKVVVDVNTETNPPSGPDQYNFVNVNSILNVSTRIEIPLELNLNNLGADQSVTFTNGSDLQDANRLLFRVIAENELPMGGIVELVFNDANGQPVFTVDEQTAFAAAPVGPDGRTTEAALSTADILFEKENITAIENATSINVRVNLSTTDAQSNQAVKFFSDYELKFKLAVQAEVQVNSNGN